MAMSELFNIKPLAYMLPLRPEAIFRRIAGTSLSGRSINCILICQYLSIFILGASDRTYCY